MQEADILKMQKQEKNYWWHVGRRFVFQSVLNKFLVDKKDFKIVDVGCGTGANLNWLKKFGDVVGVDSNQTAIGFAEKKHNVTWGLANKLPFKNASANLITAFDVLEHVKNDNDALQEWSRVLSQNGYLFISVPAYQWLYSPHDKQMQHYRRYLLSNLLEKIKKAGFKPIFSSYFFMFVFPVFIIQRLLSKIFNAAPGYTEASPRLNNFLISLSKIEAWLMRGVSLPFGSSLLILAKKDD